MAHLRAEGIKFIADLNVKGDGAVAGGGRQPAPQPGVSVPHSQLIHCLGGTGGFSLYIACATAGPPERDHQINSCVPRFVSKKMTPIGNFCTAADDKFSPLARIRIKYNRISLACNVQPATGV
jgi:hypothetical protein